MRKFIFAMLIVAMMLSMAACSGESSVEDDITNNDYKWIETELSELVPKPDADIVESRSYTDSFFADVYGMTDSDFDDYVAKCKEIGFDEVITDDQDTFKASNGDGVELVIDYMEDSKSFTIGLTLEH